ncbi:hypothetical protein CNY89_18510, partial [Amaricoccus sp. HAR-UPW-R2A-40]
MRVIHAAADSLTPSQHHAQTPPSALPERPDRQPVGDDRANDPGRHVGWTASEGRQARDRRGDPVFPAGGLRVAALAARLPTLADGLLLPAPLGARRRLGRRAPHPRHGRPGAGGPGSLALGGDPRQPKRPDGRSKGGSKGYDAGKRIHGRKRHILTDTDGRLLAVEVHGANVQDRDGAKGVLRR